MQNLLLNCLGSEILFTIKRSQFEGQHDIQDFCLLLLGNSTSEELYIFKDSKLLAPTLLIQFKPV